MNTTFPDIRILDSEAEPVSLRELGTVLAVGRYGSALRAARELGYAQSTVTLHVQNVERVLGTRLFVRDSKGLAPTPAGRIALAEGKALLERAAQFGARVRGEAGEVHAEVVFGTIEPFGTCALPAVLAAYRRRSPKVHVTLRIGGNAAMRELLDAGEIAFAIAGRPQGRVTSYDFSPLFVERFVVLVSKRHRLAAATKVRLRDLHRETILLSEETCAYRNLVATAVDEGHLDGVLRASFGTVMNLPYAVEAKLGIAIVPAMLASIAPAAVRAIPLAEPNLRYEVGMLTPKGRSPMPAAAALGAFLAERLAGNERSLAAARERPERLL